MFVAQPIAVCVQVILRHRYIRSGTASCDAAHRILALEACFVLPALSQKFMLADDG